MRCSGRARAVNSKCVWTSEEIALNEMIRCIKNIAIAAACIKWLLLARVRSITMPPIASYEVRQKP